MLPLAPGRFSTTTGTFQRSLKPGPSARARMSMPVPGVNGTMSLIGLEGYDSCACASPATASIAAAITSLVFIGRASSICAQVRPGLLAGGAAGTPTDGNGYRARMAAASCCST